jgi:hypothetical protein
MYVCMCWSKDRNQEYRRYSNFHTSSAARSFSGTAWKEIIIILKFDHKQKIYTATEKEKEFPGMYEKISLLKKEK